MSLATGYAAASAGAALAPLRFERRALLPEDVRVEIDWCGICHSDLHQLRDEWGGTTFPIVPGHEIVGRVSAVGGAVTAFAVGDRVAVGCLVDACGACEPCRRGEEQHCAAGPTFTYNAPDPYGGGVTYGGWSDHIVVDERFVLAVPEALDPAGVAPLLCAGVTVHAPLARLGVGAGSTVGVVGLGGLGHLAVRIAAAMGARVVVLTRSTGKEQAARRLGAAEVLPSGHAEALAAHAGTCDVVLDTVAAAHDLTPLVELLGVGGTLVLLGIPPEPHAALHPAGLILGRRGIAGSFIGGTAEMRAALDFCAAHGILADVETIPVAGVEHALARMERGDVPHRFVIDMASLGREEPSHA